MELADFFKQGGSIDVEIPLDSEAYWDLEVCSNELVSHRLRDVMYECADFIAHLPGVQDVPYDGGEVIPVCGSISAESLRVAVIDWWTNRLKQVQSLRANP
jgi:hypothetical protein